MKPHDLVEAYFRLRQASDALKTDARPFEGQPWSVYREKDGSKMLIYEIEDDVEVCIVFPDGTSRTYS